MTAPWWSFTDTDVRPHHPLIAPDRWAELLAANGFGDVQSFVCEPARQALILAKATGGPDRPDATREHWLIFSDEQRLGTELSELLSLDGAACTLVSPGIEFSRIDERTFQIDPDRSDDYHRLIKDLGAGRVSHCVHLWAADETTLRAPAVHCRTRRCGSANRLCT